jgi:succinate dehydrogenase/fumarate reductase flavoprotein subunit
VYKNGNLYDWPYPVRYGNEINVDTDVLILGGGIAGCWAAISAARSGARVAIVEKSATISSGAGGSGCDHWLNTPNPISKITAEDAIDWERESNSGYINGISRYIAARESYDTLLEMEQMGGKIRDTDDEYAGADFRDEQTKFVFAYDYENKYHFRVWGKGFKPALYKECKRLGVKIFDRTMATSLLTTDGKQGTRVIGATGLNSRTGEFYVFKAKATIMSMSRHSRNWAFSSELTGLGHFRPNIVGTGYAMAWRAGASFTFMEKSHRGNLSAGTSFPCYGTGNPQNTWAPCTMVDANGKEIPWVDRDNNVIKDVAGRTKPAPGQKFLSEIGHSKYRGKGYKYRRPDINTADIEQRIVNGEFALPLYADLPSMPELERKAIWDIMVANEGRTHVPIYKTYMQSGFDPNKDLIQSYIMLGGEWIVGPSLPHVRTAGEGPGDNGGLIVDWNLKTTLDGLYAAGDSLFAGNYHHHAATTGRYAGRKAAAYAQQTSNVKLTRKQIDDEKARVYAPVERKGGIEWKELNAGLVRVMQNYCGEYKNEELLSIGLRAIAEIETGEAQTLYAHNPHMLMRALGVMDIITCDQMILHASIARKGSSTYLGFNRLDYPEIDPPAYHKWITINQAGDKVKTDQLAIDFYGDMETNYEARK